MKATYSILGIFLLCCLLPAVFFTIDRSTIGTGLENVAPAPPNTRFTLEQLQADFKQLRNAMERHHPALYAHTPKEAFDRLFDDHYAALEASMDLEDSFRVFASLMARIGCGHSSVWMPAGYWDRLSGSLFPIKMRFVGNNAFAYDSYSEEDALPKGSEVLAINGKTLRKILTEVKTVISADAFSDTNKNFRLGFRFPLLYALFYGHPDSFVVSFREPEKSEARSQTLRPVPTDRIWGHMVGPERLDLEIHEEIGAAVLTIGSFGYYREHEKFFGFVDDAFERIARNGVRNLILDLRQNDGGDPFCAAHLFGYLERQPVPYFSQPYGRYARLSEPIPLADHNFEGRILILIDGGCASTTGHLCGLLKYHSLGTYIGEETGATFFCHDAHTNLNLKHTGFQVGIARQTFSAAVRGLPGDRGIFPDVEVLPHPRDLASGKDPVLELALNMCRK